MKLSLLFLILGPVVLIIHLKKALCLSHVDKLFASILNVSCEEDRILICMLICNLPRRDFLPSHLLDTPLSYSVGQ